MKLHCNALEHSTLWIWKLLPCVHHRHFRFDVEFDSCQTYVHIQWAKRLWRRIEKKISTISLNYGFNRVNKRLENKLRIGSQLLIDKRFHALKMPFIHHRTLIISLYWNQCDCLVTRLLSIEFNSIKRKRAGDCISNRARRRRIRITCVYWKWETKTVIKRNKCFVIAWYSSHRD